MWNYGVLGWQRTDVADFSEQWALVIAGISDFNRPAEKLSLTQNCALMATGAIWTRWCLIIKPRNVLYVLVPSAAVYDLLSPG